MSWKINFLLLLILTGCALNEEEKLFDQMVLCVDHEVYTVKEHMGDTFFITKSKKQKCKNDGIIAR